MSANAAFMTRKAAARGCGGFKDLYYGVRLQGFDYMAGANATGAGLDGHDAAIFYGSDLLKVRIPHGTGLVVGMAHIVAEAGAFSTNITFS